MMLESNISMAYVGDEVYVDVQDTYGLLTSLRFKSNFEGSFALCLLGFLESVWAVFVINNPSY